MYVLAGRRHDVCEEVGVILTQSLPNISYHQLLLFVEFCVALEHLWTCWMRQQVESMQMATVLQRKEVHARILKQSPEVGSPYRLGWNTWLILHYLILEILRCTRHSRRNAGQTKTLWSSREHCKAFDHDYIFRVRESFGCINPCSNN
jgi:hypothetical protein